MSYTMDSAPVPFMASRPAAAVERPREEPPTAHAPLTTPSAAPAPIGSSTLITPFGTEAMRKPDAAAETRSPFEPAQLARPPELHKPVTSLPKPDGSENGARLPSISSLDAPAEPPKATIPGLFGAGSAASILNKPVEAAAPVSAGLAAPSLPKPVEVNSVPDTPTNIGTPPGGIHRPELNILQEPINKPEPAAESKPVAATSVPETEKPAAPSVNGSSAKPREEVSPSPIPAAPAPTPAVAATSSIPGLSTSGSSLKRKLEDEVSNEGASKGPATEQAEKKAKVEAEVSKPAASTDKTTLATVSEPPKEAAATKATEPSSVPEPAQEAAAAEPAVPEAAATPTTTPKKAGRPKKDKKAAPPVGRAQRKTRSQGPAEGSL